MPSRVLSTAIPRCAGSHPLIGAVSTPVAAPVITGTRLRRGGAGSAKGAASFVAENITAARATGATGVLVARMDSAFYSYAVIGRLPASRCAVFDHGAPEPASEKGDRDD